MERGIAPYSSLPYENATHSSTFKSLEQRNFREILKQRLEDDSKMAIKQIDQQLSAPCSLRRTGIYSFLPLFIFKSTKRKKTKKKHIREVIV